MLVRHMPNPEARASNPIAPNSRPPAGKDDECCGQGDVAVVEWSLRRSNGYFVDASFGFDEGRWTKLMPSTSPSLSCLKTLNAMSPCDGTIRLHLMSSDVGTCAFMISHWTPEQAAALMSALASAPLRTCASSQRVARRA